MSGSPSDFLDRAKAEAARYGSDPWIFIRELLQNARDAGARHVVITTASDGVTESVSCRDDGDGMSFDHARRYLFTLYASSKEGGAKQAGQFGVGFWSILRFDPAVITVRSWPKKGGTWEIALDGGLTRAARGDDPAPQTKNGTEVLLTRAGGDGHLARRVFDAVWQSSRYLSRRDDASKPITLTVDGKSANAPFELPAPSASFRRGALRGVVGLGKEARVELFSKGLRVRSAPMLDDLLSASGRASDASRVSFPELEDGLAPQALLENPEIELLLSRSDVRGSKSLERTVKTAHRELERLIERQLASSRPPSFARRIVDVLSAVPPAASVAVVAAAVAVLVIAIRPPPENAAASGTGRTGGANFAIVSDSGSTTYQDLAAAYGGPQADTLERASPPVALRYAPAERPIHFTTLVVESLEGSGRPTLARDALGVYENHACSGAACVTVELGVDAPEGTLRLPVPAGHRLDTKSVRFEGEGPKLILGSSDAGEPVLVAAAPLKGVVRYVTGPAPAPRKRATRRLPAIPAEMQRAAARLTARSGVDRVAAAMKWVQEHVRYSVERATAVEHRDAIARGEPFLQRTLEIGAGDCDVQNGMLAQLLQAAGTDARLVVGYLGVNGGVQPWLHAWVEWREPGGPWRVVDASEGAPPPRLPAIASATPGTRSPIVAAPAGSPASRTPPAAITSAPPRRTLPIGARGLGLALAGSVFIGGLGLAIAERTRRSTRLDPAHDLSKLLRGALVQPDAFRHVPSLFHRPLIPLSGGGQCALAEAWVLASKSRLFATRAGSPLARAVRRAGATVLDMATREGAAVAESLGAIDLDQWDSGLRATRSHVLLEALSKELAREGEDWRLRNGAALEVLDIPVGRGRVRRWVIVPVNAPFFEEALRRQSARPKEALFRVADGVLEKLDLPEEARKRLLARLAAAAVTEGA